MIAFLKTHMKNAIICLRKPIKKRDKKDLIKIRKAFN